jgi:hypothetical protein
MRPDRTGLARLAAVAVCCLLISASTVPAADPDDQAADPLDEKCSACTLRHQHLQKRLDAKAKAGEDGDACRIKGDIDADGKRTYALPDSPRYGEIEVDTAKGERWFCSEAEALFDGWRPAAP